MLSSFKTKIGNVYYPVYILEVLTGVIPSESSSTSCVWRTSKKVKSYIFVEGGPQAKMTFILCTYIPTYFYLIYESRLRAEITNILVHGIVIHTKLFQEIGETFKISSTLKTEMNRLSYGSLKES